jgi:hypothetical protein
MGGVYRQNFGWESCGLRTLRLSGSPQKLGPQVTSDAWVASQGVGMLNVIDGIAINGISVTAMGQQKGPNYPEFRNPLCVVIWSHERNIRDPIFPPKRPEGSSNIC